MNEKNKNKEKFTTSDFYLAAFLRAVGYAIEDAVLNEKENRTEFCFEYTPELNVKVKEFFNDGTVKVRDFKNAIQDLKGVIYNVARKKKVSNE